MKEYVARGLIVTSLGVPLNDTPSFLALNVKHSDVTSVMVELQKNFISR